MLFINGKGYPVTILLHDIYVNCLNVKEMEEERERKRQYDGQINRRNKEKRREGGKHMIGIERDSEKKKKKKKKYRSNEETR